MSVARCAAARVPLFLSLVKQLCAPGVGAASSLSTNTLRARVWSRGSATAIPVSPAILKMYIAEERGSAYSPDYRVFFRE